VKTLKEQYHMQVLAGNIPRKSMGITDRLDVIQENSSQK